MTGIIIKIISDSYTVKVNNNIYTCKARGKFRQDKISPVVGDHVVIDVDKKVITEVNTRKMQLVRPPISNVDQVLIVISATQPVFSSYLLDKMLIIIEFNNIKPIICFTKLDLLNDNELKDINKYMNYYRKIGYKVLTNQNLLAIKRLLKNRITVLTGQSGVGKSTLLNYLHKTLNLQTGEISEALGRGKNTTRHVELIEMCEGLVADTPGFSALDFNDMTKTDIRDNVVEFDKYKEKCQYQDCCHLHETNCYIKTLVNKKEILDSRYDNYLKFITDRK